ncbi:MBL fold metallo-hydrolase [Marinomonas rhizomae]|uniref:Glyoxylase-like metal-dependent hydrolase (Beta-lactamase superfamily II) n=1 Tax=Marinomonas rhizomae TaxID=491948 RepID=A0A366J906_9GAMM|nr:MBL fold metallo-hydrolase [Marinomonas rhizomae]RBP83433.1 glyoxylase-like metal-dependent hydrolase (beta-lactamase superfamily II) [Marinomonas rhizomae]RNF73987.1 MBL fold metallo-hydrolase [Marinomonas rhizomae]
MKQLVTLAASALIAHSALAADTKTLTLDVYNAAPSSFGVTSTVVYGETEAMVIDAGFTKADALRIAAKVLDSKKELKTIFISQADPDYYFGAETLHNIFPKADIITTPAVKKVIEEKMAGKLAFWGSQMGANAPVAPIVPSAYTQSTLTIDGQTIEIRGTEGVLAHRPYLWIPSNKAILGNVAVFGNMHLWMADAQSDASQAAWKVQLQEMLDLRPTTVVPGHMAQGTALTADNIRFSLDYINAFQTAKKDSKNSAELIKTMTTEYPKAQGDLNLNIAAKVHKGEMKW